MNEPGLLVLLDRDGVRNTSEDQITAPTTDPVQRPWIAAWAMLPARAFLLALVANLLVWGRFLLPTITLSPEAQVSGIHPTCRVSTSQLACKSRYVPVQMLDPGAPAWVNISADYFFRRARIHGEPRPRWNPYVGSGYPIVFDGHSSSISPTQWFYSHIPGDQGRDVVAFTRFLIWTFGLLWAVGLCGAATPLLGGVAAAAVLAPYPATLVDVVFLDVDLLGPWFLLILLAFVTGKLSLRVAAGLCFALGVLVSTMGFLQAQLVFCVAVGLLALAAAPATRGRSLLLASCFAAAELVMAPWWLPLVRNLDQFVSSRNVQCIVQMGVTPEYFWNSLIHPPLALFGNATATLVGAGLLFFAPRRWWFIVATLVVMAVWIVLGLPHWACSLPLISGARFPRHLIPHFQMLFIFAVGATIQGLAERLDRKWPWVPFVAACAVSVVLAVGAQPAPLRAGIVGCSIVGAALGLLAAALRGQSNTQAFVRRAAFGVGLVLFAFAPYFFGSPMTQMAGWIGKGKTGARQIAPLPTEIDGTTPLGAVQRLSLSEDRRHYSPAGFLFPNWSAAIGVLDLLSLNALYPIGYHELNASLFTGWPHDPGHGLVPDRFIPVPPSLVMSTEFQRVLVLNRVSLLTFTKGQAFFAGPGSPYEQSSCRQLARSSVQAAESWVCPAVGGVGYFPEVVGTVRSRAEALEILRRAAPTELLKMALLGPEIDLSIGGSGPVEAVAGSGRVLSVDRQGDDLSYTLDVERGGVFVIADTYFRGWAARVNGRAAGISRANVAFKAVLVPPGRVELKLHFAPAL